MNPALLQFIILALEKGVPAGIQLYNEIVDYVAQSKESTAEEKVNLLARLAKIELPERNFIKS